LREQIYSSKTDEHGNVTQKTWFDYFAEMAQADVRHILACCENARVYNITLSDADLSAVESEMDKINFYASLYGYTANQYIKAMYGECVEPKDVRSMLELLQLSNKWRDLKRKAFFDDATDARVEAYYLANKNIYDVYCDFTSYTFVTSFTPSSNNAENENNAAKYQAEQERFAGYVDTLGKATDPVDFRVKLYNCLYAEELIKSEETKGSALTNAEMSMCAQTAEAKILAAIFTNKCKDDEGEYEEDLYEWLFDFKTENDVKIYLRKTGDINKFEIIEPSVDEENGAYQKADSVYIAACFDGGMHRNIGTVRSVGHILFKADTFDGLTSTENLTGATKEIADTVLARDGVITARAMAFELLNTLYTEGKITEETLQDGSKYYKIDKEIFEQYGELYTEDSNVFYDNVYKGQMVQEFENWLFDEKRQEGEISYTDPVKTDYGYHIMYYAGNEAEAWKSEIREEICQSDYITWFETVLNTTTYTNGDPTLWDQIK